MYKAPKSSNRFFTLIIFTLIFVLLAFTALFAFLILKNRSQALDATESSQILRPTEKPTASLVIESIQPTATESIKETFELHTEKEDHYPVLSAADGRTDLSSPLIIRGHILVNRKHPVNRHYHPELDEQGVMQKEARIAFNEMTQAAQKDGITYAIRSAYRSFEKQYEINQYYLKTDPGGIASVDTYSAPAGASEHQTGLALDLDNGTGLTTDFDETPAGKWLHENAYKYGFIIRFPKNKEHITGYHYEPWHFRYIGKEAAESFGPHNSLTLEEYLDAEPAPAPTYD